MDPQTQWELRTQPEGESYVVVVEGVQGMYRYTPGVRLGRHLEGLRIRRLSDGAQMVVREACVIEAQEAENGDLYFDFSGALDDEDADDVIVQFDADGWLVDCGGLWCLRGCDTIGQALSEWCAELHRRQGFTP